MIDLLDEITEIPFDVFWNKYQEIKEGNYNKLKAKAIWFSMQESDRITSFKQLAKNHPAIQMFDSPNEYLEYFNLPF
jgi:hypothetical protein